MNKNRTIQGFSIESETTVLKSKIVKFITNTLNLLINQPQTQDVIEYAKLANKTLALVMLSDALVFTISDIERIFEVGTNSATFIIKTAKKMY